MFSRFYQVFSRPVTRFAVSLSLTSLFLLSPVMADDDCVKSAQLVKKALELGEGSEGEIELYKEAQTLCPKMAEARFNLGLAYQKREELDAAEREIRESLRLKDDETFRVGLAGIILQKGEVSAAREQYDKVLESNPRSVPALQGIALILEKQGKITRFLMNRRRAGRRRRRGCRWGDVR